jgi:hypothetical protein
VTLTVWDFEDGLYADTVTHDDGVTLPVQAVCTLDKVVYRGEHWWEPWKRCGCCKGVFEGESLVIVTDEDLLIPCFQCETVIRAKLEE